MPGVVPTPYSGAGKSAMHAEPKVEALLRTVALMGRSYWFCGTRIETW